MTTLPPERRATSSRSLQCGRIDAPLHVIMFHGYTASPDELAPLAESIARRFDARVVVPLLPGHGTKERDLLDISFDDLVEAARDAVRREKAQDRTLVLLGHSMGGYLALLSANDQMPAALILTTTPFVLRGRFRRPWMSLLMRTRAFWEKEVSANELAERSHLFFYPRMPGVALSFVNKGIRRSKNILLRITCPILTIHNAGDPIADPSSGERILALSGGNPLNKAIVFDRDSHGLYYGPHRELVIAEIAAFIRGILRL